MYSDLLKPEHKQNGYYSANRSNMLKYIPSNVSKILDVGCGEGEFGGTIKASKNVEVWGLELCAEAAEIAKIKLDKVIVNDIENVHDSFPENYFDCIIFNDVLEHLKYPWLILEKIKISLKDNGRIVASIPNIRYFNTLKDIVINKEWKYEDEGILDKTHLRFFTKSSIMDMFNRCGYEVMVIEGINPIKFPWKFNLLNIITNYQFEDTRYMQFACVAQKMKVKK